MFVLERLDDARGEAILRIGARRVADHPLVFAQLLVEQEGIRPVELAHAGHRIVSF